MFTVIWSITFLFSLIFNLQKQNKNCIETVWEQVSYLSFEWLTVDVYVYCGVLCIILQYVLSQFKIALVTVKFKWHNEVCESFHYNSKILSPNSALNPNKLARNYFTKPSINIYLFLIVFLFSVTDCWFTRHQFFTCFHFLADM